MSEPWRRLRDGIFDFRLYVQFSIPGEKGKSLEARESYFLPDRHGRASKLVLISPGAVVNPKKLLWLLPLFLFLHLNYWMWDETRVVGGFPVNLLYHVVLSLFLSLVMALLVKRGWPRYLDED
jgi:hypothetical protein